MFVKNVAMKMTASLFRFISLSTLSVQSYEDENLVRLTNTTCLRPNKLGDKHIVYRGREMGPYHCRKCGLSRPKMMQLVTALCPRGGNHEPV